MGMVELNKGPMVGGPWDGGEHSAVIHPPDYPDYPDGVPPERTEVCRLFSVKFPEGAVYRWDGAAWRYVGRPDPNAFSALLKVFAVKPAPPLGEEDDDAQE